MRCLSFSRQQVWVQESCLLLACHLKTAAVPSQWRDVVPWVSGAGQCLRVLPPASCLATLPQTSPHPPPKPQSSEVEHRLWLKQGWPGCAERTRQWTCMPTTAPLLDPPRRSSSKRMGTPCGRTANEDSQARGDSRTPLLCGVAKQSAKCSD